MGELRLQEIWIYPIKALGGIRVSSARVMEKGLQHDRRWMLVDQNNVFMTQRIHPRLALFKVAVEERVVKVTYGGVAIRIGIDAPTLSSVKAEIWDDRVEVGEVDPAISAWFSRHLDFQCHLVSFPESNGRPIPEKYQINAENVSLADAYPFLLIGNESLEDLNRRMKEKLPMNRFRPNLVFTGGQPFEEDTWKNFRVGRNRFLGVKACGRCAVPTINQETAEKGVEPLVALSRFRKKENNVYFGQYAIALDHDEIFEGDEIVVG